MSNEIFDRTIRLIGAENFERRRQASIVIVGLGGVGGAVTECLARAGIGRLVLVDGDIVSSSDCNRQLIATQSNLNQSKAIMWQNRCREINPNGNFEACPKFLKSDEDISKLLVNSCSGVIDAIDDVPMKIALLAFCFTHHIPVISAMGAGGRVDPLQVQVADISKTFGCPLAKTVRKKLREIGIDKGVSAVFSPEIAHGIVAGEPIGSDSVVPLVFGAVIAAEALKQMV